MGPGLAAALCDFGMAIASPSASNSPPRWWFGGTRSSAGLRFSGILGSVLPLGMAEPWEVDGQGENRRILGATSPPEPKAHCA